MTLQELFDKEREEHEKVLEEYAKTRNLDPVLLKLVMRLTGESMAYDIIHGPLHCDHIFTWLLYKRKN